MTVMIFDNFLPMPSIVRHWAVNQKYYDCKQFAQKYSKHNDWPGKRSEHVMELESEYADIVLNRIAAMAARYYDLTNISIISHFQLTTKDDGDSWVHQDNNTALAGVLYLNPNPPENSGTTIYHCKDVNRWNSYMSTGEGYNTLKTINRVENINLYDELFTPIDNIGNVFNRLILYPGDAFHKSNDYFGNSVEDGRLVQVFFVVKDV
jgi:hypothetical protein